MKAYHYNTQTGEVVLTQEAHDHTEAMLSGYGDPSEYGVLFCDDINEFEFKNGEWRYLVTVEQMKISKLAEIKAEYEAERTTRNKGIYSVTLDAKIDCREVDVLNIQSIVYVFEKTGTAPSFYKTYDNGTVPATGEAFQSVLTELMATQLAMWQHKDELSRAIELAETEEQINFIRWSW